jgi:hypothetical protein
MFIKQRNCLFIWLLTHVSRHPSSSSVNNEVYAHSCEDYSPWYTTELYELRPLPLFLGTSYHGAYLIAGLNSHMEEWKLLLLPSICIPSDSQPDSHFCCPLLTGYSQPKDSWLSAPQWRFLGRTAVVSYHRRQGLATWPLHLVVILTFMDGF